jgi:hypothetical protein
MRGAMMRTLHKHRRYDLVVSEGALALVPIPGVDPATAGALLGLLAGVIGVVIGYAMGDSIARDRAAARYARLCYTPFAALRAEPKVRWIPSTDIRSATMFERGKYRRDLLVQPVDGKPLKLSWDERAARNDAAPWVLPAALPGVHTEAGAAIPVVAKVLLAIAAAVVLVVGAAIAAALT